MGRSEGIEPSDVWFTARCVNHFTTIAMRRHIERLFILHKTIVFVKSFISLILLDLKLVILFALLI